MRSSGERARSCPQVYRVGPQGSRFVNAVALPSVRRPSVAMGNALLDSLEPDETAAIFAHEAAHFDHFTPRQFGGAAPEPRAHRRGCVAAAAGDVRERWLPRRGSDGSGRSRARRGRASCGEESATRDRERPARGSAVWRSRGAGARAREAAPARANPAALCGRHRACRVAPESRPPNPGHSGWWRRGGRAAWLRRPSSDRRARAAGSCSRIRDRTGSTACRMERRRSCPRCARPRRAIAR